MKEEQVKKEYLVYSIYPGLLTGEEMPWLIGTFRELEIALFFADKYRKSKKNRWVGCSVVELENNERKGILKKWEPLEKRELNI